MSEQQEARTITLYVAEDGDNKNDGSQDAPFANVYAALETLIEKDYTLAEIVIAGTISSESESDVHAMISLEWKYPPLLFRGASNERGGILDAKQRNRVMLIGSGNTVTLGPGLTLTGGSIQESGGGGVYVRDGHLILDGASISRNKAAFGLCSGVYVGKHCTFVMKSGSIKSNVCLFNGGGVFPDDGGTFTMYGGLIAKNKASFAGGGVYVGLDGVFTMHGGTIANNTAGSENPVKAGGRTLPSGRGGGVCVFEGGVFTMHDGTISGNEAIGHDTGEYSGSGGGVYAAENGVFTLERGIIFQNRASNFGGAVFNKGAFTFRTGALDGNRAQIGGGGVCVSGEDALFLMEGGAITNNFGGGCGGAVCTMNQSVFQMENGFIADNSGLMASTLFIDSQAVMGGGTIRGPDKPGSRPDVKICENGKFTLAGGECNARIDSKDGFFEDLRAS
ncbi:MAG: hypothetical protein LBD08_03995 [Treponema sp.]|jgi:hypothetical protein|nr:hypothetical protein [Treponema sp.]